MNVKATREREFWLLVLLGVAFCWRPLFWNETFFFRDLYYHFLPSRQFLAAIIRDGQIPLWNPYLHGGEPFLANANNVALYPTVLLYLFLPVLTAFNLEISLHLVGCAAAAYVLARRLGAAPPASFAAGVVYGFCGYTLSLGTVRLVAAPLLPLLLLAWCSYLEDGKRRAFAWSAVCGALLVLSGAPETAMIGFVTALWWSFCAPFASRRALLRRAGAWVLLIVSAAGLSAAQILPTMELIRASARSTGVTYEAATAWSLDFRRLPELILPGFLGRTSALSETAYWGKQIEDGFPYIPSIYFGGLALAAALAAGFSRLEGGMLTLRLRRGLLILAGGGLLLSFGRHLPGYAMLYEWTPFLKSFRYPIKFLSAASLPIALLSCHFIDRFFCRNDAAMPDGRLRAALWAGTVILGAGLVACGFSDSFSGALQRVFFLQPPLREVQSGLVRCMAHAFLIWTLAALLLALPRRISPSWQTWLVVGVLSLDLLTAGRAINPTADRRFFMQPPESVQSVRRELDDGRLFRSEFGGLPIAVKAPTNDKIWRYRWELEVLSHSSGVFYGIPVIYDPDYDGLTSLEMTALGEYAQKLPWDRKAAMMDVGRVTAILTHEVLERPGLQYVTDIPNSSNTTFRLYRNLDAVPRAGFVTLPVYVNSSGDALAALVDPRFRAGQHVILTEKPASGFRRDCPPAKIGDTIFAARSSTVTASSECSGWLVLSEPYYPGWRVMVDGAPAPMLKANYAFSAVPLPAGTHTVRRTYLPNSVIWGAIISAVFVVAISAAMFF